MFDKTTLENHDDIEYLAYSRFLITFDCVISAFYIVLYIATLKRGRQRYLLTLQTLILISVLFDIWAEVLYNRSHFANLTADQLFKVYTILPIVNGTTQISYYLATWFFVWRYV
jgi:hypothetical protein